MRDPSTQIAGPIDSDLDIERAADILNRGGVIGIPTDTVYGIAASLDHPDAIERLFELKGRPTGKPIPILISSVASVPALAIDVREPVTLFLSEFWPGGLTVVLPGRPGLPRSLTGPDGTVGLRVPDHRIALSVIERVGGAIACTSANIAGSAPALSAHEVSDVFGDRLDYVLDGGQAPNGTASTLVSFSCEELHVLRQGPVSESSLRAAWNATQG
ncbi:MAG TPA: L-threonylcarbamoyladenylate synthase, partial [Pirellulaceae bacterium]